MVLPDVPATIFEGEAEVALVIGKRATACRPIEAMDYVFGYVNFIDGSARGRRPRFYQMKSRDTFAPIGPYIVTADEIADPHKLADQAVDQRHADAELQHRRHGPQHPALHRVGHVDPFARAGRHPGHGHQPPRPQSVPWTATRSSSKRRASAACASTSAIDLQPHLGPRNTPAAPAKRSRRPDPPAHRQIRHSHPRRLAARSNRFPTASLRSLPFDCRHGAKGAAVDSLILGRIVSARPVFSRVTRSSAQAAKVIRLRSPARVWHESRGRGPFPVPGVSVRRGDAR